MEGASVAFVSGVRTRVSIDGYDLCMCDNENDHMLDHGGNPSARSQVPIWLIDTGRQAGRQTHTHTHTHMQTHMQTHTQTHGGEGGNE